MIKEFKKALGYICPYCSSIAVKEYNLFDFSGKDGTKLACPSGACGEHCVTVTPKKDKYNIVIACPLCDESHTFNIQKITFWQSKFFVFRCPETGFGILFIGDKDEVRDEIERQEKMLIEMNDEYSVSDELSIIFDEVERINEIAKDGNVSCSCGSHAIAIEIDNSNITLCCRECGNSKEILANRAALDELLNTSAIVLD